MITHSSSGAARVAAIAIVLSTAACGSTTTNDSASSLRDAAVGTDDASLVSDAGTDAAPPARNSSCVPLKQQNGTAVNSNYGRLDGTLVFVVGVGQDRSCNGDDSHVHLQIEVSGSVYDVAVDIGQTSDEVGLYEDSISVPGGAWVEGWHSSESFAYPALGIHSSSLPLVAPDPLGVQLENLLANTSQISIFCTGYTQGNGCHDVHYVDGSGGDGAIVLDPSAGNSPALFFRFSSQNF
jgi:hypothetical protein